MGNGPRDDKCSSSEFKALGFYNYGVSGLGFRF